MVVLPTYNEAANIKTYYQRLRESHPDVALLVVDDNSPDGTGDIADAIASQDERVWVMHRPGKLGLGTAYAEGLSRALALGASVVAHMDADGSHDPAELHKLLEALGAGADIAVGSRYVPGGRVVGWPWYRQVLSLSGNIYARTALSMGLRDVTGGYRAYRSRALAALRPHMLVSTGYCVLPEILYAATKAGMSVVEVPITFTQRAAGSSKMTLSVASETFRQVTTWGLADLRTRSYKRSHQGTRR